MFGWRASEVPAPPAIFDLDTLHEEVPMALISDAATGWSAPITLAEDEIWQTRYGSVFLSTTDTPVAADGFNLVQGEGVLIRAGRSVRYRKEGPTDALIVREAV